MKKNSFLSFFVVTAVISAAFAPAFETHGGYVPPVMNLTGSANSAASVTLSWDTPQFTNAASFDIEYSLSQTGVATVVTGAPQPIAGMHQSFQVTGLTQNTTYYFSVRMIDSTGTGSLPKYVTVTTRTDTNGGGGGGNGGGGNTAVPPVMNLVATALDTTNIRLTWNTPIYAGLASFEVIYSRTPLTDASFASAAALQGAPTPISGAAQSMTASNLAPNTLYYFGIRVVNTANVRSLGAFASATTPNTITPPPPPSGSVPPAMNLTASAVDSTHIRLSWNTPNYNDLASFDIACSLNPITDATFAAATPIAGAPTPIAGAAQTITVSNLTPNTLYYCGIRVVNSGGTRSVGAYASATTQNTNGGGGGSDLPVPLVMNLAANPGLTFVDVSWDTPQYTNTLVRFELRYSTAAMTDANFGNATLVSGLPTPISGTSQGVRVSGLTPATLYHFGIVVFDARNVASHIAYTATTTLSIPTTTSTVPVVLNLAATPKDPTTITVAWDTPNYPNAAHFELIDSTSTVNDASFATLPLVSGTPTPAPGTHQTMDVTGLTPATLYNFGIRIVSTSSTRSLGAFASATTPNNGGGGGGGGSGGGGGNGGGGGGNTTVTSGGGGGMIGFLYNWVPTTPTSTVSTPSITINGGASTTNDQLVNLTIAANNCSEIMLSNNADFTNAVWEHFVSPTRWILGDGNGVKTVYGKCRAGSAVSGVGSASITLAIPANAVTVSLRPSPAISIASGEGALLSIAPNLITIPDKGDIVVVLTAHPNGVAYGARGKISYPVDSLELAKVEYGTGWVPAYGANANLEDAVYGTMVKSAYLPGGFSTPKHFATLTFHARNAGTGRIDIATRNQRVIPGIAQTAGTGVVGNDVGRTEYLLANILSVAGEGDYSAFLVLLGLLVILYMIYLGARDKKRHGKAFVYHGFRKQ